MGGWGPLFRTFSLKKIDFFGPLPLIKFCIIRVFWIGGPNEGYDEDSSRNVQLHAGDEYHVKAGEDLSKPIIRAYVGLKNVTLLTLFLSLQFPS